MDLIVVGSVAIDVVETSHGSSGEVLGGSAAYFAYAASFFCRVGICSAVGRDFPQEYVKILRERGIDLEGLRMEPGRSFRWHGRYSRNWDERVTVAIEQNVLGDFDGALPDSYREVRALFLANGSPDLQIAVLDQMNSAELIFADTMDHWIRDDIELVREVIGRSRALLVNEFEAEMLTGHGPAEACRALHEMGPEIVVVKLGSKGARLSWKQEEMLVPIYKVKEVRDPTGAGDCFGGGFAGYLSGKGRWDRESLLDACIYGTVMASFCIERFSLEGLRGTTRAEIEARRVSVLRRLGR